MDASYELIKSYNVGKIIINSYEDNELEKKLKNENIKLEGKANETHYKVGKEIRNTIKRMGGTMPEDLPTPNKSLKELEKEKKKFEIKE